MIKRKVDKKEKNEKVGQGKNNDLQECNKFKRKRI
jgi:hypothetical protein